MNNNTDFFEIALALAALVFALPFAAGGLYAAIFSIL